MSLEIEQQTSRLQGSKHIPELQAFRGLAALLVVCHHCSFYYANPQPLRDASEHILNAHAAVVSFYVLSGYVLSRSLGTGTMRLGKAIAFYIKRVFRIYPALFVAGCFGMVYLVVFHRHPLPPIVSPWWSQSQREKPITLFHTVAAFLAVGNALPLPTWSIFDEIIGSVFMPLIVLVMARGRIPFAILVAALALLSFTYGETTWMGAGEYLLDFALGAGITLFPSFFQSLVANTLRARTLTLLALFGLITVRRAGGWDFTHFYHHAAASNLEALFATAVVGMIATRPEAFAFLRKAWAVWVGDISYSLYLLHLPIMAMMAGFGGEVLHLPVFTTQPVRATCVLLTGTLLVTVPLAALNYRFVELPFMKLGKRIAKSAA